MYTEKRTKKEWIMTAEQAEELAEELIFIAEEANDHKHRYPSKMILNGGKAGLKDPIRIVAIPDDSTKIKDDINKPDDSTIDDKPKKMGFWKKWASRFGDITIWE